MNTINSGAGWIPADAVLCFLALCAALSYLYAYTDRRSSKLRRVALGLGALGWALFFGRIGMQLISGGDPMIIPLALVALSLVAASVPICHIAEVFEKRSKYGRRRDDHHGGMAHDQAGA